MLAALMNGNSACRRGRQCNAAVASLPSQAKPQDESLDSLAAGGTVEVASMSPARPRPPSTVSHAMPRFTFSSPVLSAACASLLLTATSALAFQSAPQGKRPDAPKRDVILEQPGDAWMPPMLLPSDLAGTSGVVLGDYVSIQVNIDALGANISGDAANEPSLAVDPTAPNRISVGWRQFDTIASNFRQAGNAFSTDGGRTWTNQLPLEAGIFRSDPVLAADATGTFFYYSLQGNFLADMFISNDGGANYGSPISAFGGDKAWMTIDNTGGIGDGNIYIAWSTAAGCCGGNTFTRSTDGGATYMTPIAMPMTPTFGTLDVGPNGELYIFGVDAPQANNDDFVLIKSTNAQNAAMTPTFDQVTAVNMGGALAIGDGPNPAGLLGQAWVAVDRSGGANNGNVYVCCTVKVPPSAAVAGVVPGDPADVMFARSTDGGATFSPPIRLNDDAIGNNAYQWFGTMSVAPNGRIDVIFNDTRNDNTTTFSELMYTFSNDGGTTWSPNEPLSPTFNHFLGYPNQSKLGDYYDMISDDVGAFLIYAATFNGEQDVYFLRIGDYDCNSNGIGDEIDLMNGTLTDCDGNGIPDSCEIAANPELDADNNGFLDACIVGCTGDIVTSATFQRPPDGIVDGADLAYLLGEWGPNPGSLADFVTSATFMPPPDGLVDGADLAVLLGAWGPCE